MVRQVFDIAKVGVDPRILDAFLECVKECEQCGIKLGNISKIDINTRLKRTFGKCIYRINDTYVIQLNKIYLSALVDRVYLKDTILHELCHTVEGGMCHTGKWKQATKKLNETFGYNICRCASKEESSLLPPIKKRRTLRNSKYVFECKCCKHRKYFKKKCKFVRYYWLYKCQKCGARYEKNKGD